MRQTNIELCRIFAILLVVVVHSDFSVFGYPETLSDTNLFLLLTESFAIIGVNVFVLITGYFSVTPKKSSLLNLTYICLFYAVLRFFLNLFVGNPITLNNFLFISNSNWFIPCYFGLLLFAPALNALCNNLSKRQLVWTILLIVLYETYIGFLELSQQDVGFRRGYSVLSFMVLYLIARYIKLYDVLPKLKNWSSIIYIICSFVLAVIAYLLLYFGYGKSLPKLFAYVNPLIIFSSISFFLLFEKMELKYNKTVNHIAKSCLAVLLVHACSEAVPYMHSNYQFIYSSYSGILVVVFWIVSILVTFLFAVLIDQIRIYSYKIITRNNNQNNGLSNSIIQS